MPAGTYSLYTVPGEKEWEVIVNRSITQWGHESSYTAGGAEAGGRTRQGEGARRSRRPVEKLTFTAEPNAEKTKHLVLEWADAREVAIPLK